MITVNMDICFLRESSVLPDHLFVCLFLFSAVIFSLLACLFAFLSFIWFFCLFFCLFLFVCLFVC